MARWNRDLGRTATGAKRTASRKKMRMDRGYEFLETKVGERRVQRRGARGNRMKHILLAAGTAVVSDPKTGKAAVSTILTVVDNPANPNYARQSIITKRAVIKTEAGLARVTNSPSRDGCVNAVQVEEKK